MAAPLGLLTGMLPGIGPTVALIMLFAGLSGLPADVILSFYVTFIIANVFSSSVVTLWLGVMGDVTSMPIMRERNTILKNGLVETALWRTAQASAVATVLSLAALYALTQMRAEISWLMRTETLVLILVVLLIGAMAWKNAWWINLLLLAAGMCLGKIGYNDLTNTTFGTFGIPQLLAGIPTQPFLMGIYALPLLWYSAVAIREAVPWQGSVNGRARSAIPLMPTLRGTVSGFLIGLVPWVGVVMSSNFAYGVEQRISKSNDPNDTLNRCTAAEASNNAANVSMLLPVLLFGIAISPSEVVILNLLWQQGWTISSISDGSWIMMTSSVIFGVCLAFFLCTVFARHISVFVYKYHVQVLVLAVSAVIVSMYYFGNISGNGLWYIIVMMAFTGVGIWLHKRNIDVIPAMIGFLIVPELSASVPRLLVMYNIF